jgi:hypothetical protein
MSKLYHVSSNQWQPGDKIEPGNWGNRTRQFGRGPGYRGYATIGDAAVMVWEVALEAARRATGSDAPSRLDCVFCCEDIASAKAFRDRFASGSHIFEVEVDDSIATHVGNYEALTDMVDGPTIDTIQASSLSYWKDEPKGIREIVVGGSVKVLAKVDA